MASGTTNQPGRAVRVVLLAVWVVFCLGLAELACRVGWRASHDVSLRDPGLVLFGFYPEMWNIVQESPRREDAYFDILLLGGSVLHPSWGSIEQQLLEQLALAGHRDVRVMNLGTPGHTSLDSLVKYRALSEHDFELVFVYHGVNETRTNNAPPDVFREDYGHYAWYEVINTLAPYHGRASFSLPYTLRYVAVRLRQTFRPDRYILQQVPREDWTRFGSDVRSAASLESNLSALVDEAAERGDRVMLATFAYHVPPDYSLRRFEDKQLDYTLHLTPLEIWGEPENVVAGLDAHNEVVRRLARERDVWLVDQAGALGEEPANFNDPVHLTTRGSRAFALGVISAIPPEALPRRSER